MSSFVTFLEEHMLQCPIKATIGLDCLGCGMQRSFVLLLKGNIVGSIQMYPALLPILAMLIFLCCHIVINFKYGARILQIVFISNISIIILNYLLKL